MNKVTIHVIHLSDRKDRYDLLMNEQRLHSLEIVLHEGIRTDPCKIGISQSHKKIIQWAKNNNQPEVIAAEDDMKVCGTGAIDYFLRNKPTDYDLYLASIYTGEILNDNTVKDFSGLTFYICHSRFYDEFLSLPSNKSIDRALAGKGKFVVSNPFCVIQHETYSDNNRHIIKNEKYLKGRSLFNSHIP